MLLELSDGMVLDEWVSESYRGAEVRFGGVKFVVLGRWGDDPVLRLSGCDDILYIVCFRYIQCIKLQKW